MNTFTEQTEKQTKTMETRLRNISYLESKSSEYQETVKNLKVKLYKK